MTTQEKFSRLTPENQRRVNEAVADLAKLQEYLKDMDKREKVGLLAVMHSTRQEEVTDVDLTFLREHLTPSEWESYARHLERGAPQKIEDMARTAARFIRDLVLGGAHERN